MPERVVSLLPLLLCSLEGGVWKFDVNSCRRVVAMKLSLQIIFKNHRFSVVGKYFMTALRDPSIDFFPPERLS